MTIIIILTVIGFFISLYAYIVERKIKTEPQYKPFCDFSDIVSCSKPLASKYAQLFYISNSIAGMIFYLLIALLAVIQAPKLLLVATSGGMIMTLILAYILYVNIKSFCLICTSIYLVNSLLFISALLKALK